MDVFISYRRDGAESLAQLLYTRLKADGYDVFLDVESLRSGDFNEALYEQIDQCSDFLLLLPPHGLDRCAAPNDWVRLEVERAIQRKKNIIPVMMRNFEFPEVLPGSISQLRNYNGVKAEMDLGFDAVLQKLEGMLSAQSLRKDFTGSAMKREDREFYKIKTGAFNHYKRRSHGGQESALWEKMASVTVTWFRTKKEQVHFDMAGVRWGVSDGRDKLVNLKQRVTYLRSAKSEDKSDLYFFNNALLHWVGLFRVEADQGAIESNNYYAYEIDCSPPNLLDKNDFLNKICFIFDIPKELFWSVCEVFDAYHGEDFHFEFLPIAFDVWPDIVKKEDTVSSDFFSDFASMLFDFILESNWFVNRSLLPSGTWYHYTKRQKQLAELNKKQILAYYAYLRKNEIYLPKSIQKKVYERF